MGILGIYAFFHTCVDFPWRGILTGCLMQHKPILRPDSRLPLSSATDQDIFNMELLLFWRKNSMQILLSKEPSEHRGDSWLCRL